MNIQYFLFLTLVVALGGIISLILVYFLVKNDIKQYFSLRKLEDLKGNSQALLPIRLQAHERLILLIERINPVYLLVRIHQKNIEIGALQNFAINEINAEFQHNIAQQLYVDAETWNVVKKLKDDTIAMINNGARNLPINASGIELSKLILEHMSEIQENPYDLTINLIKQNIQKMF